MLSANFKISEADRFTRTLEPGTSTIQQRMTYYYQQSFKSIKNNVNKGTSFLSIFVVDSGDSKVDCNSKKSSGSRQSNEIVSVSLLLSHFVVPSILREELPRSNSPDSLCPLVLAKHQMGGKFGRLFFTF